MAETKVEDLIKLGCIACAFAHETQVHGTDEGTSLGARVSAPYLHLYDWLYSESQGQKTYFCHKFVDH